MKFECFSLIFFTALSTFLDCVRINYFINIMSLMGNLWKKTSQAVILKSNNHAEGFCFFDQYISEKASLGLEIEDISPKLTEPRRLPSQFIGILLKKYGTVLQTLITEASLNSLEENIYHRFFQRKLKSLHSSLILSS